jgi:hypothetical protein
MQGSPVNLRGAAEDALRESFLGWQCRLRQIAVREHGGRPSPGMRPALAVDADEGVASSIVVLIVEKDPARATEQLRHIFRQTHDPRIRYDRALALLCAGYFQFPRNFSDVLTASFGPESTTVACLTRLGRCVLDFDQFGQRYRLPCSVQPLARDAAAYQATYWHNALFDRRILAEAPILGFRPDWRRAEAVPAP